ncbi:acyloxyacyl hydrolase [Lutibacter sp. HS1-25]|uniref:acyloxyacyl hydrolase n=1 Tax=Lutibacter sp. HS1-25 TaxID=2485000 RepID=UPI001F0C23E4|nr:acyloxyacyl hydrolase [Lutibacter sp. HS1-25]
MRKTIIALLLLYWQMSFGQTKPSYFQADYFYGNILNTNPDATIFLQGHPTGVFASYNIKTYGLKNWQGLYKYPDVGISFGYQDYKSKVLGELYSLYSHYNFYLTNRTSPNQLVVRAGIGLAYNTKPYDKDNNNKNTAFGTAINSSTYFKLYYQRNYLLDNLGVTAGLTFVHASNANLKSPNSGVNTWAITAGLNYNLTPKEPAITFIPPSNTEKFTEPIKLNLAIRGGANESSIINSGIKPFFVASAYLDKRISRKSAFQIGSDLYISPMLKNYYDINLTIPISDLGEVDSFSRISLFAGYELFINKLSIVGSVGYYVKYPFPYDGRVYETLGLKRYIINNKWFLSIRLKAHAANAETAEFGIGIRI